MQRELDMHDHMIWERNLNLLEGEEYLANNNLALVSSKSGFDDIIKKYVYISPSLIENTLKLVPGLWKVLNGIGIDLGAGVGAVSSVVAKINEVESIYSLELTENCVRFCHPIIKENILRSKQHKVISVLGDFDNIQLEDSSLDFAISWDSMHHSIDLPKTLKEVRRVLKPEGYFVVVDRGYNNSTTDEEIKRLGNIVYDKEFLKKSYLPVDKILTRKQNGENDIRFREWEESFVNSKFKIINNALIKTKNQRNIDSKNDASIPEIFVDYKLGGYMQQKNIYILKNTKHN